MMRYRKPRSIGKLLGKKLRVEEMGTGLKRGMVLKVYKAKIKEVMGGRTGFAEDIASARLVGQDDSPTLVIHMASGSHWRNELHMQRYQIKEKINERLKDEFLKDVVFK